MRFLVGRALEALAGNRDFPLVLPLTDSLALIAVRLLSPINLVEDFIELVFFRVGKAVPDLFSRDRVVRNAVFLSARLWSSHRFCLRKWFAACRPGLS